MAVAFALPVIPSQRLGAGPPLAVIGLTRSRHSIVYVCLYHRG